MQNMKKNVRYKDNHLLFETLIFKLDSRHPTELFISPFSAGLKMRIKMAPQKIFCKGYWTS